MWYDAVYRAVQQVPEGKCTTYGHIAHLLGSPQRARQVGVCLRYLPPFDAAQPDRHKYHTQNVPWQRIVNAKGGISARDADGVGAQRQAQRLRAEGVAVRNAAENSGAQPSVDFAVCGWFPEGLPDGFFDDNLAEDAVA